MMPYRNAGTTDQAVARCLWCASAGVPEKPCAVCFVNVPAQVDEVPRTGCPRCDGALSKLALASDVVIYPCEHCGAAFVPPRAWTRIGDEPDLATALDGYAPASRAQNFPLLECPVCAVEMERGAFAATSPTTIDVCPREHGLWLDAGELSAALAYARHRDQIGVAATRNEYFVQSAAPTHAEIAAEREIRMIRDASKARMVTVKRAGFPILFVLLAARFLLAHGCHH